MDEIVWTEPALQVLDDIGSYIALDSPRAAEGVVRRIVETVAALSYHPRMGRVGRDVSTREMVVVGTPYIAEDTTQYAGIPLDSLFPRTGTTVSTFLRRSINNKLTKLVPRRVFQGATGQTALPATGTYVGNGTGVTPYVGVG